MIYASSLHGAPDGKAAEYLAGWKRARAQLDNLQKRLEDERARGRERIQRDVLEALLPVADNFRALVSHVPEELADNNWAQGATHVARQFEQVLNQYGVDVIADTGEFDPHIHEAVERVEDSETTSGAIVEIVQAGYRMGDTILRPAKVKVAE